MDRKRLTNLLAVVGILLIGALLGLRLWANSQRNALPQLSMVHVAADGRVYAMLADTLYILGSDGTPQQQIPLSRFGIGGFWGDFVVLSDGSIILPANRQPPDDLAKEARIFARIQVTGDAAPDAVSLTRCSLRTFTCTPLSGKPLSGYFRADRTFKLAADEAAGRLYVSDTAAQRLQILDLQGRILASKTDGLNFPNQLGLAGPGLLRVADTNDDRLLTIPVTGDRFGTPVPRPLRSSILSFSHDAVVGMVSDAQARDWVVMTDESIHDGQIYILSGAGAAEHLHLPAGSDVLFLAAARDKVLAPDQALYAVHAFDLQGKALPDFGSGDFAATLADLRAKHALYATLFDGSLDAMFVAIGLLFGVLLLTRVSLATGAPAAAGDPVAPMPPRNLSTPQVILGGQPQVFRRRLSGPLSSGSRKLMYLIMAAIFGLMALLLISLQMNLARHGQGETLNHFLDDPRLILLVVATAGAAVYMLLSLGYERLSFDRNGIRYTSLLGGPAALFAPLYPSWSLAWSQVTDIRLVPKGQRPNMWYFQLTLRQGGTRRIGAFAWADTQQPDDTGLSLRALMRNDANALKAALADTRLFAVLEQVARSRPNGTQDSLMSTET